MAFSPHQTKPAPAQGKDEGSVLRQDQAAGAKLNDTQRQRAEDDARVGALRTMNAVRMLGPVLAKVVSMGGSDEDQATRFSSLMDRTHTMAQDAVTVMGLSHAEARNQWMINVFERTFAEALARNPDEAFGREMVRALAKAAKDRSLDMPAYQDVPEEVAIMMARVQSMGPVLRAQLVFDFARPRDATIEEVVACMDEEVVKAIEQLVDPLTGNAERRTMFSVVSQEAGELMAEAWQHEATRAIAALKKKTQAERDAWKAANPQGLPIDTVMGRFRQQMGRLVKLSKQIRPSTTKKATSRK